MVIFSWDKRLELGIERIDKQHRKVMELSNTFFISYKCGDPYHKMMDCLSFLEQYVLYHFQAEEAFQSECHYPDFRAHQARHNMLQTQVKFHATRLSESHFSQENTDKFYDFMRNWVMNHILIEDIKFADYYHNYLSTKDNPS